MTSSLYRLYLTWILTWLFKLFKVFAFQTRPTLIPSQEAFALGGEMVPVDIMFRDPIQARLDRGKNFDRAYRSLMISGGKDDYQMATPEWFDRLNQYLESTKKVR